MVGIMKWGFGAAGAAGFLMAVSAALFGSGWSSYARTALGEVRDSVVEMVPARVHFKAALDQLDAADKEAALAFAKSKTIAKEIDRLSQRQQQFDQQRAAIEQKLAVARIFLKSNLEGNDEALNDDTMSLINALEQADKNSQHCGDELERLQKLQNQLAAAAKATLERTAPIRLSLSAMESKAHADQATAHVRGAEAILQRINSKVRNAENIDSLLSELRTSGKSTPRTNAEEILSRIDILLGSN